MINGIEYAYEDIEVVIQNSVLIGIEGVSYGVNKAHYNIHGKSNIPVAMGRGKKDAEPGSVLIHQSEFEALEAATPPGNDPTDWAPFDMTVAYAPTGGVPVVDVVPYCRVNRWVKGMTTEDGHKVIELELTTGIPKLNV